MEKTRWQKIQAIYERALELTIEERSEFLLDQCGADDLLHQQVQSLLLIIDQNKVTLGDVVAQAAAEALSADTGAVEAERLGQELGTYRLLHPLGQGGMGTVYLAERADDQYHKQVAIKLLNRGMGSRDMAARFVAERQILANLEHPYITRLIDGGTNQRGDPYLVMEYVDGQPIDHYCAQNKLTINERLILFCKVCEAVQHAHRNLVVHRDLKPANILITPEGEPKLLDFGIAKLLDPNLYPQSMAVTQANMRLLTPDYASPEQARGENITTASDIYSLGVILYQLLTGSPPFRVHSTRPAEMEKLICLSEPVRPSTAIIQFSTQGTTEDQGALKRLCQADHVTPKKLKRILRGDLDNIVLTSLRKEAEQRYGSAESFAADIDRYLKGIPVQARPSTLGYQLGKFVQRNRKGVALGVCLLAAFVGLFAYHLKSVTVERNFAQAEARKSAQVVEFMISLFESSDPYKSDNTDISAKSLMSKGVQRIDHELKDQPLVQAALMDAIGRVYSSLGLPQQAEDLLGRSLELRRELLGKNNAETIKSHVHLAKLFLQLDRLSEGLEMLEQAQLSQDLSGSLDHLTRAKIVQTKASILWKQARFEEAGVHYQRALEIHRTHLNSDSQVVADILYNMAILYLDLEDYPRASEMAQQSHSITQRLHPKDNVHLAWSFDLLGQLEFELNNPDQAIIYFKQAAEIFEKILGPDHIKLGSVFDHIGYTYLFQDQLNEATHYTNRALEVFRNAKGSSPAKQITPMTVLALIAQKRGEINGAHRIFSEVLELTIQIYGDTHPKVADVLEEIATLHVETGDYSSAEKCLKRVVTINAGAFGEQSKQALHVKQRYEEILEKSKTQMQTDAKQGS